MTTIDQHATKPAVPEIDTEEAARARGRKVEKTARWVLPITVIFATLAYWQWYVVAYDVPHYLLPGPGRIWSP